MQSGSSSSNEPRARGSRLVLALAAAALFLLTVASFVWFFGWDESTPDVTAYWRAATHFRLGEPLYGPPPPGVSPKAYLYPPAFAVLFCPLTLLAPLAGYAVWMALHFVFLFALVFGCARLAGLKGHAERTLYLALLLVWLPAPVGGDFQEGQANLFVAMLVVLGLVAVEERRWWAGGSLLALAVHMKLLPVVLFGVLLMQRRWQACVTGAVAIVALVLLPSVVTVPREGLVDGLARAVTLHLDYVRVVLAPAATDARVLGDEQFYVLNNSFVAVLHRLFGDGVAFSPFPELAAWRGPLLFPLPRAGLRIAASAIGGALLLASLVFAFRCAGSRPARAAALGASFLAIELATLNCWEHHLVFVALLLAPLAALPGDAYRRRLATLSMIVVALWTAPYLVHPFARLFGYDGFGVMLATTRAWGFPTLALVALIALALAAYGPGRNARRELPET